MKTALIAALMFATPAASQVEASWGICNGGENPGLAKLADGSFNLFWGEDGNHTNCRLSGSTLMCADARFFEAKTFKIESFQKVSCLTVACSSRWVPRTIASDA